MNAHFFDSRLSYPAVLVTSSGLASKSALNVGAELRV